MVNHGIYVSEQATSVATPVVANSGIPFFIGTAPVQSADNPAQVGVPVLATSFEEAKKKLGYSDDWKKYTLCEAMYSHFVLYGCQPAIFVNVMDPKVMKETVLSEDKQVKNHKIELPIEAINDETLVVKAAGGTGEPYIKDIDYAVYYANEKCIVELLVGRPIYSATNLNISYTRVTPTSVSAATVATGMEAIEECMTRIGVVPDIICAPGFSDDSALAAVMTTKAAGINGMFKAVALIDISTKTDGGADTYDKVLTVKTANNLTDKNQIICWPLLKLGDKIFHMSTHLAGRMSLTDIDNDGMPNESPSNKAFKADAMVDEAGNEIYLTLAQSNYLNAGGVVTALSMFGGLNCWGNYTACYPTNTDVKDYFTPINRMFKFVGNTIIKTFWIKLDKPTNRTLIDSIIDTINIWLNGLAGAGKILGARAEFKENENSLDNLMAGKFKIHIYMTPPSPAQQFEFILEYDANYVTAALAV